MVSIWHVLAATLVGHLIAIYAAVHLPELGDEPSFKAWAIGAATHGVHLAYRTRGFGYDWLPLYLYVSKSVGWVYLNSGLASQLGSTHHALTVLLKLTMTLFHLASVYLVYLICERLGCERNRRLLAALAYGLAPGTLLATAAFGYQDAYHTLIVVAAFWCFLKGLISVSAILTVAAALTKPQAAIYIGPFWLMLILCDRRALAKSLAGSAALCLVVVSPFLFYDTMSDVVEMYARVPEIHQWLTGCAHNIWWLLSPVPPFVSDRKPHLLGLNGLQIGLGTFAMFCLFVAVSLVYRRKPDQLAHGCAFLAFAFFMVVTQIHENHLYACFPFLAVAAALDQRLRKIFVVLTMTFAADLVLTLYLLRTDVPITLGPIRLSLVNAAINVCVLVVWTRLYLRDLVFVGWMKRQG